MGRMYRKGVRSQYSGATFSLLVLTRGDGDEKKEKKNNVVVVVLRRDDSPLVIFVPFS